MSIRVLIVDDSALIRTVLAEIINGAPDMQVVGSASGATAARELVRTLNPDVLTLDVEMPGVSGLEFLDRLMRAHPMPVVMVSAFTERGSETTLKALELGAVDFVAKPKGGSIQGLRDYAEQLREKLRAAAHARIAPRAAPPAPAARPVAGSVSLASSYRVIVVGASTGGTEAIRELLARLPANTPPVLVTQHMPETFTKAFAARLNAASALAVSEAVHGEPALAGHAYIAPGHSHLLLVKEGGTYRLALSGAPPVNRHRPSVDVLFNSAAEVGGGQALGVILTGMGKDGAAGMLALRQAGAYNFAQDEASCVVFGMPREAIACGAVHEIVPMPEMAQAVLARLMGGARPARRGGA
ncbi:MAG: chemotaxis response regulator protein-glutamate methylesterase [Betaproteobacteria bacterium]|nr:chemotaxis response regulator protein-glutamate methylesterase [Betaproteobacteria bacterium]